jgi:putative peptide zinc metalloprotease protein
MTSSSLTSSTSRPLRLRRRQDLIARRHQYHGTVYYLIKDPITLKYFRFQEEEYALLEMLDGETSLDEIQRRFEQQFAPQKITVGELGRFVGMLYHSSLVLADAPDQGRQLLKSSREKSQKQRRAALSNVLCVRFTGFDPDEILNWLSARFGWFFSMPAVLASMLSVIGAVLLIASEWAVFQSRLPYFEDFFAAKNWIWLAGTLAVTKILHEFGHGLACKRLGGECHEMGLMFLVLTPCLYCNVSDSWMLPNKWHRAAIGAAGMYVEIVLASICTFIWWFTHPGALHYLCLNVMFVSSVSTILFNANPLLRYDGYYILADLVEIPNLRQKASQILQRMLALWMLGIESPEDPFLPQKGRTFFALYTVAAAVYRWVIAFSIIFFLNRVFEPYGLKVVGQVIAIFAVYGLLVMPAWQFFRFLLVPGSAEKVKVAHALVSVAEVAVILAVILVVPLPYRVSCPIEIQPRDATSVYVATGGTLRQVLAKPGDELAEGQPIAQLENVNTLLELAQLEGERQLLVTRIDSLRRKAFTDDAAALEAAEVQKSLAAIHEQIEKRQRDLQQLTVASPVEGTFLPPPYTAPEKPDSGKLPRWGTVAADGKQ